MQKNFESLSSKSTVPLPLAATGNRQSSLYYTNDSSTNVVKSPLTPGTPVVPDFPFEEFLQGIRQSAHHVAPSNLKSSDFSWDAAIEYTIKLKDSTELKMKVAPLLCLRIAVVSRCAGVIGLKWTVRGAGFALL